MPEKLKPCPFCGGEAITLVKATGGFPANSFIFKTYCPKCEVEQSRRIEGCFDFEVAEKIMQEVIHKWNTRVPDTNVEKIEGQEV